MINIIIRNNLNFLKETSGRFSNAAQICFGNSPEPHAARLDHVLIGYVVDSFGGENAIGASAEDLLQALLQNVHFSKTDLFQVLRVSYLNGHAHVHAEFRQIQVKASDFRIFDSRWHLLAGSLHSNHKPFFYLHIKYYILFIFINLFDLF